MTYKRNIDKLGFIKILNVCPAKGIAQRMKRQATDEEKILAKTYIIQAASL